MRFRNLDSSSDWSFGSGKANYATDENAIEINISTRIKSWVNNCYFDLGMGIDWTSRLDVGQQENLLNDLNNLIAQSYGVIAINSITANFDPNTRGFSVSYNIDTIYSSNFIAQVNALLGATNA